MTIHRLQGTTRKAEGDAEDEEITKENRETLADA